MVYRIYVEKKPGFDGEAQSLRNELVSLLGIKELNGLRLLNRYDVEGIDEALFEQCVPTVFSEPPVDNTYAELPVSDGVSFAVEYLPGQFDQRADSAAECIQLISQGDRPLVRSARVYLLEGTLTDEQVAEIKKYVINPVEAREASLDTKATLKMEHPVPTEVEVLDGFNELDEAGLKKFIDEKGLAMDLGDIKFCQEYFRSEKRDPTITEIKMIDTYWSDHCRHTTFGTILDDVQIDDAVVQEAFDRYMAMRADLGRENKPRCMMDLATIGAKELKKQGILKNLDESEEINACTVKIKCDVNGKDEDWLFLFKNETHNHPTEIEPFGGAATCIGGAIQQPLLLVLCRAVCGYGSPRCGSLGVFAAFGGVGRQPKLPAAARCDPRQQRVIVPGLWCRSGAKLLHNAGEVRHLLAEEEQIQLFAQPVQPPQPTAALPGKGTFHRAMEFLWCRQRRHGAAADGVKLYTG